jgi:hypothetical protein
MQHYIKILAEGELYQDPDMFELGGDRTACDTVSSRCGALAALECWLTILDCCNSFLYITLRYILLLFLFVCLFVCLLVHLFGFVFSVYAVQALYWTGLD